MPIWFAALKVIPWTALLTKAPAIVRAANTLLSGSKAERHVADRLATLDQQQEATAALLKEISDQISALTAASEVLAARLRWLTVIVVVTFLLAGAALVTALLK